MKLFITIGVAFASAMCGAIVVVAFQYWQSQRQGGVADAPVSAQIFASRVEGNILATTDHQAVDNVGSVSAQVQVQSNRLPQQKVNESRFDKAEADARAIQHIQDRENIFAAELVDGRWAIDAIKKFQADLTSFEGAKFKLANLDCRSTTCRALLNFESYASAQAQSRQLVERAYTYNCAKEIVMPQATDFDASYQATLYLDCRKLRSPPR